jgi:hypothetical protein
MTVVSALSPLSLTQFFYDSGKLVRPARLFFYKPGTEDRVTVYTDVGLSVPYDQPLLSGGSGRVPPVYIGTEPYRVRVFDSYGGLIEDIDSLPGAAPVAAAGGGSVLTPAERTQMLQTGDYVMAFRNNAAVARDGFVRANGGIIGPAGFTGIGFTDVERLNDDTHALFVHLWGQDTAGTLQILPSKGADAESDWNSLAKVIRLPDLCGRALTGIDGMGLANKNRLTGAAITGAQTAPGASGGAATATMTAAQLAAHSHSVANAASGISLGASGTGIISTAGANAGIAEVGNIGVTANSTGITATTANNSGAYLVDPGHSHGVAPQALTVTGFGAALPGGGVTQFATLATTHDITSAYVVDPTHSHGISDPTHSHSTGAHNHGQNPHTHPITDLAHNHVVIEPNAGTGHTHALGSTGSSQALPTAHPFVLAMIYIKL